MTERFCSSAALRVPLLLVPLALAGCGFHLRQSAALPPSMKHLHVAVSGNNDLQHSLEQTLAASGVTIADESGPGIAELKVPVASFSSDTVSISGNARVTEYAVRLAVQFEVQGADGATVVPLQHVDMQREYSYDATNTIGNSAQVEAIEGSLNDDMVQSILFRLQAAAKNAGTAPAGAAPAASTR